MCGNDRGSMNWLGGRKEGWRNRYVGAVGVRDGGGIPVGVAMELEGDGG